MTRWREWLRKDDGPTTSTANSGLEAGDRSSIAASTLSVPTVPRTMSQPRVREQRANSRYLPHVEPINRLVDRIAADRNVRNLPYLDPTFGGTNARVLLVMKAPEADANPRRAGTRFLSMDNDDDGAENVFEACSRFGLDRSELAAWNVCPFPIRQGRPSDDELAAAAVYHRELLTLMPNLKVVVLLGQSAREGWPSGIAGRHGCMVLEGASPSPPGVNRPHLRASFESSISRAAEVLEI